MTPTRRILRSGKVRLTLLGASAFALAGCFHEQVEATVFPDADSCRAASDSPTAELSAEECEAAYAEALAEHERTAPRYDALEVCEEEHGGQCYVDEQGGGGGGSIFLPLLAGYMIGNMLGGGARGLKSQPLYATKNGRYATANGSTTLSSNRGRTSVSPASFKAAPTTAGTRPMSRTAVQKTGGFGAARTGASRSFGG
ncbi:hypothetical protein LCGC14_1079380 [marine sediment metagenome]|uniref:DUF1190 domain-containing protein n=1 Tax=marine sediment metagenome TaxID=412755 RepID=A0A0F9N3B6_9ZZZZ